MVVGTGGTTTAAGAGSGSQSDGDSLPRTTEPVGVASPAAEAGPVMVIEDDRLVRAAVSAFLEELGCEVLAAPSAAAALAMITPLTRRPRLLICDYGLPGGVDGLQAILSIRRELGNDFVACLMTGLVSPEVRAGCREAGVPLLYKPVSPATLRSIVREACG